VLFLQIVFTCYSCQNSGGISIDQLIVDVNGASPKVIVGAGPPAKNSSSRPAVILLAELANLRCHESSLVCQPGIARQLGILVYGNRRVGDDNQRACGPRDRIKTATISKAANGFIVGSAARLAKPALRRAPTAFTRSTLTAAACSSPFPLSGSLGCMMYRGVMPYWSRQ
jgi:hypothetical protein